MQAEIKARALPIPVKLYRIGDIVRHTPFSRQTIHNYTTMGLIREAEWTEGGHRLYDESVFERLSRIIELKKTRTLWEIRSLLNTEEALGKASLTEQSRDGTSGTTGGGAQPPDN